MENGKWMTIFHFPFALKNENNGMYTDRAETSTSAVVQDNGKHNVDLFVRLYMSSRPN